MKKICIDAGHAGMNYNKGVSNGYVESVAMWKYSQYLGDRLKEYGVEVIYTRKDINEQLGVYERGKKSIGCDLFISCHSNAYNYTDQNQADKTTRVCVYHSIPRGGKEVAKAIGDALAELYTEFDPKCYAKTYTRAYSASQPNRDYYGVIRGASDVGVVGLIVEHSFHTSRLYCNWATDENLKRSAIVEADAIAKYYGLTIPEPEPEYKTIYSVQVGAFSKYDNAKKQLERVKNAGFDAYIFEKKVKQ